MKNNLIWIDLEMTGLNPEYNNIIEIATVITDKNLNIMAEGPVLAIYQSNCKLKRMDKWNLKVHSKSGLLEEVKNSNLDEALAEFETINFLKKWISSNESPICGNSVIYDRRFLLRYMPKLESYFHYRCLDVSSIRELAYRWKPEILNKLNKKSKHRALHDIYDSIHELSYYRKHFFNV